MCNGKNSADDDIGKGATGTPLYRFESDLRQLLLAQDTRKYEEGWCEKADACPDKISFNESEIPRAVGRWLFGPKNAELRILTGWDL